MSGGIIHDPKQPAALTKDPSQSPEQAGGSHFEESARDAIVEDAYNLFCDLRARGEAVSPSEFCARYPAVQSSLGKMLTVHKFIEANPPLVELGPDEWPREGQIFAGFMLVRKLGEGSFARVFEATELALGERSVALKISALRGKDEAATLGRMSHPNIVPVYSVTEEKELGLTAVCMPYHGDATLLHVLDHIYRRPGRRSDAAAAILEAIGETSFPGRITRGQRCEETTTRAKASAPRILRSGAFSDGVRWLAIQIAEALVFIHGRGMCHWDIKPSNILMRPDGTPMLMDFNLAVDTLVPDAGRLGTPAYMSPERLRTRYSGSAPLTQKPDARSDLYSLGVMLYELLTGRRPFGPCPAGADGKLQAQLLLDRQPRGCRPIREVQPDVDPCLARAVEKCLAFELRDRPQSAAALLRELRGPQVGLARVTRWLRRRTKAVAAVLAILGFFAVAAVTHLSIRPPAHVTSFEQGRKAYESHDFRLAVSLFTESLRAEPDQSEVFFERGRAFLSLANGEPHYYALASADLADALRMAPCGRYKAYLAYSLHKQNQLVPAITYYEQALKEGYESASVHNNLAQLMLRKSKLKEAETNLEAALRISPRLSVARYNKALLYLQRALAARNEPADEHVFLEKGIAEFKSAGDPLKMTGAMTFTGAIMCSLASRFDERLTTDALNYLALSLTQGINPATVASNPAFSMLKTNSKFADVLSQAPPAKHAPIAAVTFVEPTTD